MVASVYLNRLKIGNWPGVEFHALGLESMVPAVGQAAIAVQCRAADVRNLLGGAKGASLPLDRLLYRHLQIIGTVMKSRPQSVKQAMTQRFRDRWLHAFDDGTLVPVIDSEFALADAAQAHRRMESSASIGKIILTM